MRPAGILLALLSCAALPWPEAIAATPLDQLTLPRTVTVTVDVYQGTLFKKVKDYQKIVDNVFDEASAMLDIYTKKYGTVFTLSRRVMADWDDRSFTFNTLEKESIKNPVENINLYTYFANNKNYNRNIRKSGLRGTLCGIDKDYRTLLFNQYDFRKRAQTVKRRARILVYYVGMLLGMNRDKRSKKCPTGLMDWLNWGRGDRLRWNECNVRDLATFYGDYIKNSTGVCVGPLMFQGGHLERLNDPMNIAGTLEENVDDNDDDDNWEISYIDNSQFPTLTLRLAFFYDSTFPSLDVPTTVPNILLLTQNLLNDNENGSLGINFQLKMDSPTATPVPSLELVLDNADSSLRKTAEWTTSTSAHFFIFLTKKKLTDLTQSHGYLGGGICRHKAPRRTFVVTQKYYWPEAQFTVLGLSRQLVYFIARSIGVKWDSGKEGCPNGFMQTKTFKSEYGMTRSVTRHWNRRTSTNHWNRCNIEEMHAKVSSAWCLPMVCDNGICKKKKKTETMGTPTKPPSDVRPVLELSLALFYDTEYKKLSDQDYGPYGDIPNIIRLTQRILNQDSKLGIFFKLNFVGPSLKEGLQISKTDFSATLAATAPITRGRSETFFVFFSAKRLVGPAQYAHRQMADKVCSDDPQYRTFALEQSSWPGYTSRLKDRAMAKILVYYIARSIGVLYDRGKSGCPNGYMKAKDTRPDYRYTTHNVLNGGWLKWNDCNAKDMKVKVNWAPCLNMACDDGGCRKGGNKPSQSTTMSTTTPAPRPVLELSVAVFYDTEFSRVRRHRDNDLERGKGQDVVRHAQNILNQDRTLGIKFKLNMVGPFRKDALELDNYNVNKNLEATAPITRGRNETFFLFLSGRAIRPKAYAHSRMAGKVCSDDPQYRTFTFEEHMSWSGITTLTDKAVAKLFVYYIGRSIGILYDTGKKGCPKGYMAAKDRNEVSFAHDNRVLLGWNRDGSKWRKWNRCNAAEMKAKVAEQTCLSTKP